MREKGDREEKRKRQREIFMMEGNRLSDKRKVIRENCLSGNRKRKLWWILPSSVIISFASCVSCRIFCFLSLPFCLFACFLFSIFTFFIIIRLLFLTLFFDRLLFIFPSFSITFTSYSYSPSFAFSPFPCYLFYLPFFLLSLSISTSLSTFSF